MAGVALDYQLDGAAEVVRRLGGLAGLDLEALAFNIGALLESATQARIADEKAGPDGAPWADWSEAYAATRGSRHSLLVGENILLGSVQNYSTGTTARVGSNMVYAAIHQFGGAEVGSNIPARPYLGLSGDDRAEIRDLVIGEVREALR
ncbi:MAG: phage virion morphogenesis protein [Rhodobacter sp.]|nr:phage virion morphogenesis protein [Rhodobacter sp.]